jgi:hypothetical protein
MLIPFFGVYNVWMSPALHIFRRYIIPPDLSFEINTRESVGADYPFRSTGTVNILPLRGAQVNE